MKLNLTLFSPPSALIFRHVAQPIDDGRSCGGGRQVTTFITFQIELGEKKDVGCF